MARTPQPRRARIVRYRTPDGRECKKGAPGAVKHVEESRTYFAKVGGKKVALKTTDLGEAWARLRELLARESRRAAGIPVDEIDHAARPLAEHVEDWLAAVADEGTGEFQIQTLRVRVTKLAGLAGWKRLHDLTADSCLRALARLTAPPPDGLGLSAQTRNHYLTHAKQFCHWCLDRDRLAKDPLRTLSKVSVEADRRHDRREPTAEEVRLLMDHLHSPKCPVRKGMTGPQRALGYKVAMATGLRANELRSLTRASFDLAEATVTLRAAYDKRRRLVTQPLPDWLVAELRAWFDSGGGCWSGFPAHHPGRVLRRDLRRAGVAYSVPGPDGPRYLDMHSLRVWYCTELANQSDISPKTLMTLCRHSTPTLTLKVYAKAKDREVRAAVGRIKRPGETSAE